MHLLRWVRREDDSLGLSAAQLSAISTLVTKGELTLTQLADAEGVRPPTITRLVQRLEADGYVIREELATDKRVTTVRHTSKAWTMLEMGASLRAAGLSDALASLSAKDTATLERAVGLIERITAAEIRGQRAD